MFEKECNNKIKELKEATGLAAAASFKHVSPVAVPLTKDENKKWLRKLTDVALGSDAFFPFGDNIKRDEKNGVSYIAQSGGSIRDDNVVKICDKYDIAMAFIGIRLFHH